MYYVLFRMKIGLIVNLTLTCPCAVQSFFGPAFVHDKQLM